MNAAIDRAKSIFLDAVEIAAPEERRAFIETQCAGDLSLRGEVEALLRHQQSLGSFLDSPPAGLDATVDSTLPERPGTVIGPYKLLEEIGDGGMGVVFLAEQQRPVRRQVALKVIKAGMDTRQVVARFESERQALALMDHPNIAKVFDAGATDTGRPYFVMELVKGVPITRYCDERRLTPRDRLALFVQVCAAVQHAHTKGIIHRDLKPSNVMIALYDGKPVPKVIDFGVAKATGGRLTEHTVFTGFGSVVGTPEYMSPEQAELNQLDVDTRSDVYSLGVLLYELLTGSTPVERGRFKAAALLEMLRVVREEEAPRPSTRLSTTDQLASIAASRGLEPKKLSGLVRGELDWIVMRCLEKDRNRRYETASGLARDVERYLNDDTVQACPPSSAYRFWKFARRNKGPVLALSLILLGLIAGIVGTTIGMLRAQAAREAETNRREIAQEDAQKALAAAALADQAAEYLEGIRLHPTVSWNYYALSVIYARGGHWEKSKAMLRRSTELDPSDVRPWYYWAGLCLYTHDHDNYRSVCRSMIRLFGKTKNLEYADKTAKTCALVPGFGADAEAVIKLTNKEAFKAEIGPLRHWFDLARALVEYRAGHFESAAAIIAGSTPTRELNRDASAFAILAMARHHLGNLEEARTAFANAQRLVAGMPNPEAGEIFGDDFLDWLHAQILCREAERVLKEPAASTQKTQ
jgi:serine/threonine protein kinase